MKAEANLSALSGIVRALKPFIGRHVVPALETVRLSVSCDRLTLDTFDYDSNARAHIEEAGISDGTVYVSHAELSSALAAVKPTGRGAVRAIVTLAGESDHVAVSCDGQTVTVPTVAADDMPARPLDTIDTAERVATFTANAFADIAGRVIGTAAGKDPIRPILSTLHFHRDRGAMLTVEATDTYRLHRVTHGPVPTGGELWDRTADVIAEATTVTAVARLSSAAGKGSVTVSTTDLRGVLFESPAVQVHTRNVVADYSSGTYPDMQRLFENRAEHTWVTVDAARLSAVAKSAGKVTGKGVPLRLSVDVDSLTATVTVWRDGAEAFRSTCALLSADGDGITVGLNPAYLADTLDACTGTATLALVDTIKPVRFTSDGPTGCERFDGLVQPIRLA